MKEIAPGKKRNCYLLGHLIAVHDDTLPVLNFGNKLYPELFEIFIKSPDKAVAHVPPATELRTAWKLLNEQMTGKMNSLSADDWFQNIIQFRLSILQKNLIATN